MNKQPESNKTTLQHLADLWNTDILLVSVNKNRDWLLPRVLGGGVICFTLQQFIEPSRFGIFGVLTYVILISSLALVHHKSAWLLSLALFILVISIMVALKIGLIGAASSHMEELLSEDYLPMHAALAGFIIANGMYIASNHPNYKCSDS